MRIPNNPIALIAYLSATIEVADSNDTGVSFCETVGFRRPCFFYQDLLSNAVCAFPPLLKSILYCLAILSPCKKIDAASSLY